MVKDLLKIIKKLTRVQIFTAFCFKYGSWARRFHFCLRGNWSWHWQTFQMKTKSSTCINIPLYAGIFFVSMHLWVQRATFKHFMQASSVHCLWDVTYLTVIVARVFTCVKAQRSCFYTNNTKKMDKISQLFLLGWFGFFLSQFGGFVHKGLC